MGKLVYLNILGQEKYGRLLAEVYLTRDGTTSVNTRMVGQGYAKEYNC